MTETKSPKKDSHILHKFLPCETSKCQPPAQRGYGEGQKGCVSCTLLFILGEGIVNLEVLQIWEESNEIQDLPTRAGGRFKSEEPKRWREVSKALLNGWHEVGYSEEVYSEFLEIRKCREMTQCSPTELFGSKLDSTGVIQADPELFNERKKAEIVRLLEWPRPQVPPVPTGTTFVGSKAVVKVGDGSSVP